jgi:hypothetical protein
MNENLPKIDELDKLLRSGRGAEVRKVLLQLDSQKVSREQLADWANLSRRSGMVAHSLRLLRPVLRLKKNLGQSATPKERASYAASLGAIGALSEAFSVLDGLEGSSIPEVQLFYGFTNVYSWNYASAAPFFRRYSQLEGPSEFQRTVSLVNLAAAHCFLENYSEALVLTESLIRESELNGWVVLQTEAHLLAAQALLNNSCFTESQAHIDRAWKLSAENNLNLLNVEKWRALLSLKIDGPTENVLSRLDELKNEARASRSWEITRDCDYHLGLETQDRGVLERVYFGTPFVAYRNRLLQASADWFKPRAAFTWCLNQNRGPIIDLAKDPRENTSRREDSVFTRALRALSSDFYRPLKIGCLFNAIYPGEFYDPESSPIRVKTALSRTRALLQDQNQPLEIRCLKQDYYLASEAPLNLRVKIEYPTRSGEPELPPELLRQLRKEWPHKSFSCTQASKVLAIPSVRTQRLLKLAADRKLLYKSGAGRSRLYRFKK